MRDFGFHVINSTLSAGLSIIANITLLILSLSENDPVLKGYRRMLVTVCINDLIFTFCVFIGQQQVEYTQGYAILFTYTPLRHLGLTWMYVICFLHITVIGMAATSMLLEFYFRYQIICLQHIMSTFEILRFMFFAFLWSAWDALCTIYGGVWTRWQNPDINKIFEGHDDWFEDEKPMQVPMMHKDSPGCYLLLFCGSILVFGSYLGAVYYGCSVHLHLSNNTQKMSTRTRRLQWSINKVMVVQAFIPFLNCALPIAMAFSTFLTGSEASLPWRVFGTFIPWIPVLNPISTIIFVGPFRRKIRATLFQGDFKSSVVQGTRSS